MKLKFDFSWNWIWFCLFAIGFGIFLIIYPKGNDDYWFMWEISGWYSRQGIIYPNEGGNIFKFGVPWHEISETIKYHLANDNVRLANIAGAFMLIFPKWFCSLFSWGGLLFSVYGCLKLADIDLRKSWLVGICLSLWVMVFYWYNEMGSVIFQFNYLVSGALYIGLMLLIKRNPKSTGDMIGLIVLTLISAFWHEGFAVPFLISLVVLQVCFKDCRNRSTFIVTTILTLSLFWHFGWVSTEHRMSDGWLGLSSKRFVSQLCCHCSYWLSIVLSIIFIFKRGFKSYITDRLIIFLLVSMVTAFGISYYVNLERAGWWGDVSAVIMILYLFRKFDIKTKQYVGWRGIMASILLLIAGFQLTAADIYTIKWSREFPLIIKNFIDNPSQTQFSQLADYPWKGWWFNRFMHYEKFNNPNHYGLYYDRNVKTYRDLYVVPASLRHVRIEECTPISGNSGLFLYQGKYMIKPGGAEWAENIDHCDIKYMLFAVKERSLRFVPFVSDADGKEYQFVYPAFNHRWESEISTPQYIRIPIVAE